MRPEVDKQTLAFAYANATETTVIEYVKAMTECWQQDPGARITAAQVCQVMLKLS